MTLVLLVLCLTSVDAGIAPLDSKFHVRGFSATIIWSAEVQRPGLRLRLYRKLAEGPMVAVAEYSPIEGLNTGSWVDSLMIRGPVVYQLRYVDHDDHETVLGNLRGLVEEVKPGTNAVLSAVPLSSGNLKEVESIASPTVVGNRSERADPKRELYRPEPPDPVPIANSVLCYASGVGLFGVPLFRLKIYCFWRRSV